MTINDSTRDCDGNGGHGDYGVILQDVTIGGRGGGQRVPGITCF